MEVRRSNTGSFWNAFLEQLGINILEMQPEIVQVLALKRPCPPYAVLNKQEDSTSGNQSVGIDGDFPSRRES